MSILESRAAAIAYYAPERMTDGTWNLYLLAVHPEHPHPQFALELFDQRRLTGDGFSDNDYAAALAVLSLTGVAVKFTHLRFAFQ